MRGKVTGQNETAEATVGTGPTIQKGRRERELLRKEGVLKEAYLSR